MTPGRLLNVHNGRLVHLDRLDIVRLFHPQLWHPDHPFLLVVEKISKRGILQVDPHQLHVEPLELQTELGHKVEVEVVDVDDLLDVHGDLDPQLIVHALQGGVAGGVALVVVSNSTE